MKSLLTIHATMTPADMSYSGRDIDRRDRHHGYSKCGYHFVIQRDGVVCQFRKETESSIFDDFKSGEGKEAISFCLVGGSDGNGAPENNFTLAQWDAARLLLIALRDDHTLTTIRSKTPAVSGEDVSRILEG